MSSVKEQINREIIKTISEKFQSITDWNKTRINQIKKEVIKELNLAPSKIDSCIEIFFKENPIHFKIIERFDTIYENTKSYFQTNYKNNSKKIHSESIYKLTEWYNEAFLKQDEETYLKRFFYLRYVCEQYEKQEKES